MKHKLLVCVCVVVASINSYAQEASAVKDSPKKQWYQNIFLDTRVNYLAGFTKLTASRELERETGLSTLEGEVGNIALSIGAGYDFGRFVPRMYFTLLQGSAILHSRSKVNGGEWSDPNEAELDTSTTNIRFGIEGAFKVISNSRYSLLIPVGVEFGEMSVPGGTVYIEMASGGYDPATITFRTKYTNFTLGIEPIMHINKYMDVVYEAGMAFGLYKDCSVGVSFVNPNNYFYQTGTRNISFDYKRQTFEVTAAIGLQFHL